MSIWETLGIEPTRNRQVIRRAYAEKTKTCHPEEDPDGFAALHEAYDAAMRYARAARTDSEGQGSAVQDAPAPGGADASGSMPDMPAPGEDVDAVSADSGAALSGKETDPQSAAAPQYDFDAILGAAGARRQQQYEDCCRRIMARIDEAITRPASRYELEDLFDSPEFLWVKDTPFFMQQLIRRLQQGLPAAGSPLAELLIAAYPPRFPPAVADRPAVDVYTALFGLLVPLQLEQRRIQQRKAEYARRRYAARVWCVVFCLATILFFVLGVWLTRLSAFCLSSVSFGIMWSYGWRARTGHLFGPQGSRSDILLHTVLSLPSYRRLTVYWIAGLWLFLIYFSGDAPFLLTLGFYALFAVLGSRRYRALPGTLRWAVFAAAAFCVPTLPVFAVTHISTAGTAGAGFVTQLFVMPLVAAILAFLAVPAGK